MNTDNLTKSQKLELYQKELSNRKTDAELAFEKILNELNLYYEPQKVLYMANAITDYFIPYIRMCYEIDGEYHNYRRDKDSLRSKRIRKQHRFGIKRFSNEEVLNNPEQVKSTIQFHIRRYEESKERKRRQNNKDREIAKLVVKLTTDNRVRAQVLKQLSKKNFT